MRHIIIRFAQLSPYIFTLATLIIGVYSPDYNHLSMTISRLSISSFGWIQTINFLVFAAGLLIVSEILTSKMYMRITFRLAAITLILLSIFPTDPIDTFPRQIFSISPTAGIHFVLVCIFIILAPAFILVQTRNFKTDDQFKNLRVPTIVLGWSAFILSIIWLLFFYFGILNNYRGLFQKIIFLEVILWIILVTNRLTTRALQNAPASPSASGR